MNFLTGPSNNSWQPIITGDTSTPSYWLNWRVFLCSIWVLISLVFASILISKYECPRNSKNGTRERLKDSPGVLYADEVWRPCLRSIHPAWLLGYRIVAFIVLLLMLILNVTVDGGGIFYYYTQWAFMLVTFYFVLGSLLSMYGCYQYHKKVGDRYDDEHGANGTSRHAAENSRVSNGAKGFGSNAQLHDRQIASFWGYCFQIIFQMNAGAVLLTDCVFWFIIVPFLAIKDYSLNFLIINMHSINAVFLLGETALNCLRFPWFRIAYFFLWTAVYVIFQWIVHACIALWWPYPFLDLSSPYAPLVFIRSIDAPTMLLSFCFDNQDETLSSVQMVPAVLSVCSVMHAEFCLEAKLSSRRKELAFSLEDTCQTEHAESYPKTTKIMLKVRF